ncbi:hypothetical protein Rvan_1466 [Rhodomicrobium vannielii ATCC 17100]|uniref:Uncharacterized protein n=1 Tax=Rhodomicrobium vannielii (strain ATCC 17100 / DSM 162 / LMG 4299 / NCIMB 10020 / ATH 3.1.1) TaxID=648757 RepID=E3I770_RHOVT|nr:hypothetical protein [Rhodomicrobium vannielii]ADP70721.1 hypothetical protein Rvan_1466 [Rhodomicrobium vannielii ATCC 17100]
MIRYAFRGFPAKGEDGRNGLFDGIARLQRTGPDYRGERWTCTEIISAKRQRDGASIATDFEIEIAMWLASKAAIARDIEDTLAAQERAANGKCA